MRTGHSGSLTGVATAALLAVGVLTAPPAVAATGDIITIAGSPGSGPALELNQDVVAVAMTASRVWVVDSREFGYGNALALRTIDRTTGNESAPLFPMPVPGRESDYSNPTMAAESNGNVLVAYNDPTAGGVVVDVSPTGQAHVIGGGGKPALAGVDGLAATAETLGWLNGIAVSATGVIYLSQNGYSNDRSVSVTSSSIRKIGTGGKITTVVGAPGAGPGLSGDGGPGVLAQVYAPHGLAVDPAGNLYIADSGNVRVRRLSAGLVGTISTVATAYVTSVAYDSGGLYYADLYYHCAIYRLDANGRSTVAGNGTCGWSGDGGPAREAEVSTTGIAALGGVIAFAQPIGLGPPTGFGAVLREVDTSGTVRRLAGSEQNSGDGGPALNAQLHQPAGSTAVDTAGNVYVADGTRLRRIAPSGTITTVATVAGGIGDIALAPNGDLYLVGAYRIYRLDASGTLLPVVGDGVEGFSPDGTPATVAHLRSFVDLALDPTGALVFSDGFQIRRLDATGALTTIAGQGGFGSTEDGAPATGALGDIAGLDVDATGRILFVDAETLGGEYGWRVRRIGLDGILTTLAGGGSSGSEADGLPATSIRLNDTWIRMALDPLGRVLITEPHAGRVRRVSLDGTITTVVGGGTGPDGGPAVGALLEEPSALSFDSAGNLYVSCKDVRAPYGGGAVRKVTQP
jgi:hypothetical protein